MSTNKDIYSQVCGHDQEKDPEVRLMFSDGEGASQDHSGDFPHVRDILRGASSAFFVISNRRNISLKVYLTRRMMLLFIMRSQFQLLREERKRRREE